MICTLVACTSTNVAPVRQPVSQQGEPTLPRLTLSENNRYLVTEAGVPFFPMGDTRWYLGHTFSRNDITFYLDTRKAQGFNTITMHLYKQSLGPNIYGDRAFYDNNPAQPITKPGADPNDPNQYDYWDHMDFAIGEAQAKGFYVVLLPTWGDAVAGAWPGTGWGIFDTTNAYEYGRFIGDRYKSSPHILWMLGGDRAAVVEDRDYRPLWRAMAEGIADGVNGENSQDGHADYSTTLISYQSVKNNLQSSDWFHDDPWLTFNAIQEWPENQISSIDKDWNKTPVKPTWMFEGRYENYAAGWDDWQMRYQVYQPVFAGGLGGYYGQEALAGRSTNWSNLTKPGALDMQHVVTLMNTLSPAQFLGRIPDQSLLEGDTGIAGRLSTTKLVATRGADGDYAMIYSGNGRDIRVKMASLAGPSQNAY